MNLNNLKPAEGSTHHDRRIGRGQGSGRGGTSTRGHKGAQSRSGYSRKRIEYKPINLSVIDALVTKGNLTEVNVETLIEGGYVSKNDRVKILGNGTLSKAVKVTAHAFSKSAVAAIEAKEGSVVKL